MSPKASQQVADIETCNFLTAAEINQVNASFSENALRVMKKRYLTKRSDGTQETPAEMLHRIAHAVAAVEHNYGKKAKEVREWERKFFDIMANKEFTPAGRTITNAGAPSPVVANCIVLPVPDTMEGIFKTLKDAALLQKAGSGLGFSFGRIRPAGTEVFGSLGMASGPISFLQVYNQAFGVIKQQCFAKGTRIVTQRGLIPIEEVVIGDKTYTDTGWYPITEIFNNGIQETLRVCLDNGFEIELTIGHQVAVLSGTEIVLKQVGDLTADDVLLLKLGVGNEVKDYVKLETTIYEKSEYTTTQIKNVTFPQRIDEDFGYWLGYFWGNGTMDGKGGQSICVPQTYDLKDKLFKLTHKLFGFEPLIYNPKDEKCHQIKFHSVVLNQWLEINGIAKGLSTEIEIPEQIFRSSSAVQMAFIAGFFDADGDNGAGKNLRISTTSKKFSLGLQQLLLVNGIGSTIIPEYHENPIHKTNHRLTIAGQIFTNKFAYLISTYSNKLNVQQKVKDFTWVFPFSPQQLGYQYKQFKGIHDGIRKTISYGALQQIDDKSSWLNFLPVRVSKIEDAGEQTTYDFEVKEKHMINAGLYTKNSRNGANMAILPVDHPDILDFIHCKKTEGDIRNFNISVGITDEFMKAVTGKPNEPWLCKFEGQQYKPRRIVRDKYGVVVSITEINMTAKELYAEIVQGAWNNGEPGVVFLDAMNRTNTQPQTPIEATNPCVTGDTMILTDKGYLRIDSIVGQQIKVWNGFEWSDTIPELTGTNQEILEVEFSDGVILKCTPYHGFYLEDGSKVEAKSLKIGDKLIKNNFPVILGGSDLEFAYTHGFYSGDGSFHEQSQHHEIWLYGEKRQLLKYLSFERFWEDKTQGNRTVLTLTGDNWNKLRIPLANSLQTRLDWLAGLIDSDGTIDNDGGSASISSINREFLFGVKLLLNTLGVKGSLGIMKKACSKLMPNGKGGQKEYDCQESYRLVICASAVEKLIKLGLQTYRVKLIPNVNREATRFVKINKITDAGIALEVFCFNEPLRHTGIFNGIITGQCGEQALPPYDVCNLGSINLAAFVKNGQLDIQRLEEVSSISTRFLDNVIDLFDYPVKEVQDMSRNTRRLGLGVMGFADMLYQLGIQYDSEMGTSAGEQAMMTIQNSSHNTSMELAEEKGAFPHWQESIWAQKGIKRRNTMVTTVAPTGSISMFFDTSSGIEPNFALAFTKQDKDGHTYKYLNRYLEEAIKKQYSGQYVEDLMNLIIQEGSVANLEAVPKEIRDTYRVAMDISAESHIRMQAAFQKYVENSISKTINFPNEASIEDIENGYILAWKLGCKGCTLYRDGSRDVQVLMLNKNLGTAKSLAPGMENISLAPMPTLGLESLTLGPRERPEVMHGSTYRLRTPYGNLFVTINEDENGIFEIFSQLGKAGGFFQAQTEAICRMVSLALRSGIEIKEIIKQIKGIRGPDTTFEKGNTIYSIPDAIGQVLENHYRQLDDFEKMLSGTETTVSMLSPIFPTDNLMPNIVPIADMGHAPVCPDCDNDLIMTEGCLKCPACGFSKCG